MSQHWMDRVIEHTTPDKPVLIAGPTASGKSALALSIAQRQGGVIVNADASQVYDCWRILTARPNREEEACAKHLLYGHVSGTEPYSAGHWLREVVPLLNGPDRPIIVGGTGLYFSALTHGLAEIPATPAKIRAAGDALNLNTMLTALDARTRERIDVQNRARVQRAWEVLTATGKGLADWQEETPAPVLPLEDIHAFVINTETDWLNQRIEDRFDHMLNAGVLEEAAAIAPSFDPSLPAHRAIGGPELVAYVNGTMTLEDAREAAIIATRQYAKRQRTWFRSKMKDWFGVTI